MNNGSVLCRSSRAACGAAAWRHAALALALLWLCAAAAGGAQANPRYAGLVIDAVSGEVLYEDDADALRYPASLTKIMTLFLTFEALEDGRLGMNTPLTVSRHAAGQPPSHLGLPVGATIRVEDAIYALVTRSANDIAVVLAEGIAGSERAFARLMTQRARELGMAHTTFRNASGLPDRNQRTTARDMARLSQALLRTYPQYYHYFRTRSWSYRGVTHGNHNRLLGRYEGVDGIKTGYIRASGFNLAASAVRGRLRLICIVFGGRTGASRNDHVADLFDRSFNSARGRYLVAHGSMPFDPPVPGRHPLLRGGTPIVVAQTMPVVLPPDPPAPRVDDAPAPATPVAVPPGSRPSAEPVPAAMAALPRPPVPPRDRRPDLARLSYTPVAYDGEPGGDIDGEWAIQVGAYTSPALGEQAMGRATARLPHLLSNTAPQIVAVGSSGDRLFRARLTGLSAEAAAAACTHLVAAGDPCLTVGPE
jgi:D-alanyl-D-alanine carboxypeptidase